LSHFRPKEVLHRAQQSEKLGKAKEASSDFALVGSYLKKKKRFSDAIVMFDKSIRLTPDSGRLYLEKAICEWLEGARDQALEDVDHCVRIGLEKRNLKPYLSHLKKECEDLPELRRRFFECWLSIDRTHFEPFLELGHHFVGEGHWSKAKTHLLMGLKLDPTNELLIEEMENALNQLGSQEERDYFVRFRGQELSISELATLLGEREVRFEASRSIQGNELKGLKELVSELERELDLDSEDRLDDVEPLVREFIRRSDSVVGEDGQSRFDLACAFYEMGRKQEALSELGKISSSSSVFSQALILKGKILVEEGSWVAAMGVYLEAVRATSRETQSWKEALYQLVLLNLKLGDSAVALKNLNELEKVDPSYRDLKTLKKELQPK